MRILRALFLLLVLANLLLFAAGRGYFGRSGSGEPERLSAQLQPEKIRILRDEIPQPVQPAAPQSAAAPAAAPAGSAAEPARCLRYEPVGRDQAGRIAARQRARNGGVALAEKRLEEPTSYWVSIAPQPTKQDLEARTAELKNAGVTDFFVISGGDGNRGAVSLGLFKSERMAESLRDKLRAKGVNGVRVSAREAAGAKLAVELRGPPAAVTALAADIAAELPDLKPGDCPAER